MTTKQDIFPLVSLAYSIMQDNIPQRIKSCRFEMDNNRTDSTTKITE
jgi:hypothetical protein